MGPQSGKLVVVLQKQTMMGSEDMEESLSVLLKWRYFIRGMSKYHEVSLDCPTCGTCESELLQPISIAPYITLPPLPALFPEKITELELPSDISEQG